jgi:hypothetical protein
MSSILDMARPGPGGPLPPPPGMTPGPVPGMMPGMGGPGESPLPIPDQLQALMSILGVDPGSPAAQEGDEQMSPVEHVQAAMMHLMMAFTQEGDHSKGMGLMKGMGALQGVLAGAQKEQAAQTPPPALGG